MVSRSIMILTDRICYRIFKSVPSQLIGLNSSTVLGLSILSRIFNNRNLSAF